MKSETQSSKNSAVRNRALRISGFGLLSDFDIRISDLFSRRLNRQRGERNKLVCLAEIIRRPLVLEQHDGILADVVGEARAGGERDRVQVVFLQVRRQPAYDGP